MQPKRRHLLTTIGGFIGLTLSGWPAGAATQQITDPWTAQLLSLIEDRGRARLLGAGYLACHPEEGRPAFLSGCLRTSLLHPGMGATSADMMPTDTLRAAFETRVRQDFARRDTVVVAGWVVSRTEARLCALCV